MNKYKLDMRDENDGGRAHTSGPVSRAAAGSAPLFRCRSLEDLEEVLAELPVSRRRAYVLHVDPGKYLIGDPARGSAAARGV